MKPAKSQIVLTVTSSALIVFCAYKIIHRASEPAFSRLIGITSIQATLDFFQVVAAILTFALFFLNVLSTNTDHLGDRNSNILKSASSWLLAASIIVFTFSSISIILVDPRGLYRTNIFEPRVNPSQNQKLRSFRELGYVPDVMIYGNSRAFSIPPDVITRETKLTAFNWSVIGGTIENGIIFTRYILRKNGNESPYVYFVEVSPPILNKSQFVGYETPLPMLPDMNPKTQYYAVRSRIVDLFNIHQLTEGLYVLRYHIFSEGAPLLTWTFDELGMGEIYFEDYFGQLERIKNEKPLIHYCTELDTSGVEDLVEFVALAKETNSSIVFYVSPMPSDFHDWNKQKNPDSIICENLTRDLLRSLSKSEQHVFFLDYLDIGAFNGLDNEKGFYDHIHLKPENGERLIETSIPTILEAYQVSVEMRKENSE